MEFVSPRQRAVGWGHRVLSTFIVAWMTIALQPCSMALEAEPDCPHCPPTEQRELPPCDVLTIQDCAVDDQLSAEPRSFKVKAKNSTSDLPVAIVPATNAVASPTALEQPAQTSSILLYPSGPPRNVLFCVYLK